MKSVLISIQPKWCELIASGKKMVEARKTKPKLETPFKVYIYETQGRTETPFVDEEGHHIFKGRGQVIGEFVCDKIVEFENDWWDRAFYETAERACLRADELAIYLGKKDVGYGWHISDLVIYDEPRALQDFIVTSKIGCCNEGKCRGCQYFDKGDGVDIEDDCVAEFNTDEFKPLRRPPQSWCYVEEVREDG